jgi:hypothetical protein
MIKLSMLVKYNSIGYAILKKDDGSGFIPLKMVTLPLYSDKTICSSLVLAGASQFFSFLYN